MSKDIDETIKKAEETLAGLDEMMNSQLNDAEQKIKKGIVQGVIWVLLTVVIYFIWGTTWFFWVSFGFNVIAIGGIVFAKVMIAKAKNKISKSGDTTDYDFDADIVDDEDVIMNVETKIFGKQKYSSDNGLSFDEINMTFNERTVNFRGMIFEDLNEVQVQKAVVLLDKLEILDEKARNKWIELLEEEDEEVCGYIDIHYNEYGKEVRDLVFKKLKVKNQDNSSFIKNLEFGSFHITEGDEEDSVEIVMDYSLIWENGTSFTDQILAMHFNDKLEYEMHTHDS